MNEADVLFKVEHGYATITLNRPKRYNSILSKMYTDIRKHLESIENDDNVKFVVITGKGQYFTSGADVQESFSGEKRAENAKDGEGFNHFQAFIHYLIEFRKPLIAAVNGPAVGIGVTILPLCDTVFASTTATFMTPFSKIGIVPEACSSFTLARSIGSAKAGDMLLFNRTLSATEALNAGLVSQLFPAQTFHLEVEKKLSELADLPIKSLIYGKELMRNHDREILHKKHKEECERLEERFLSGDIMIQFQKIMQERMKKKRSKL